MTNHEPDHERELWARFTSGAELTPEERARLAHWIEGAELEDELLDDLHSHRALHALPRLDATHERFVEQTWSRAFAAPAPRRFGGGSVAFAAAAALALLASGWMLGRETARNAGTAVEPLADHPAFATLKPRSGGASERVGNGHLTLPPGGAELRYDDGATFALDGLAELELVSPREIVVARGTAEVDLPREIAGFVVRTPTSRVKDGVARFRMIVDESGETALTVERGELAFEPGRQGAWPGRTQRLSSEHLKTARVQVLERLPQDTVLASAAAGEDLAFSGLIVAEGRVLQYDREPTFQIASRRVAELSRTEPELFAKSWREAAESGDPVEIRWVNGTKIELSSIAGLKQLEHLAESFELEFEKFPGFVAPRAIAVQGHPLEQPKVFEVRVPGQAGQGDGHTKRFQGFVIGENGRVRLHDNGALKAYTERRLKALRTLNVPVDVGGH